MTKYHHMMIAAVLILELLSVASALNRPSTMSLENNGYKNMVIAVDAKVQEDPAVVQGIKDALTSASKYLYNATRYRAFFKEITILLPSTWTPDASYAQHTSESVSLADVIMYDTSRTRRALPHTRSYEGCGRQGVHVLLTHEFATQPRAAPYFSSPGKYFVHAFAQFRWGVFQEFAEVGESEFYLSITSGHPEGIRCVYYMRGLIQKNDVNHTICYTDIDPATGLYTPDCKWRPYPYHQRIKASFMDHHYINEIVTFCDDSSDFTLRHNYETPSKHNRLCDHRSTWDIITNTPDFENGANPPRPGLSDQDVTPTFKIVRAPARRKRAVIMMDVSSGKSDVQENDIMMSIAKLKHELSKHSVEISVQHSSTVSPIEMASPPDDSHFVWLYSDNSTTNTSELAHNMSSASFVLLTSDPSKTSASLDGADHVTCTSAGKDVFMDTLRHVITSDLDMSEDIVTVQRVTLQIPPEGYTGSVTLDTSLQRTSYFRFHYDTHVPTVELKAPSGTRIDIDAVNCHVDTELQVVEFTLDDQFEVGTWLYYIRPRDNAQEDVSVIVTSLPNKYHEDHLAIKASARKYMSPYNHLVLHVDVLCHMDPVVGLHVTARVTAPDGGVEEIQLLDNGAGADTVKQDGVYSRYYTNLTMTGIYHVTFVVIGHQGQFYVREDSEEVSAEDATDGGDVIPTVKSSNRRPTGSDVHRHVTENSIRHYAESDIADDVIPPSRISDLKVLTYLPYKRSFVLQWTAPGDNLDSGKVSQYHIWVGRNLQDIRHLRDMPSTGNQSATGHVTVESRRSARVAGETEIFIWPVDFQAKTFAFGVQAEDAAGNMARMSNIATGSFAYS